jgi:hypothetical protein
MKHNPTLPFAGEFDSSGEVADVGASNNFAGIIWTNAIGELGTTQFMFPSEHPYGNVIAPLPAGAHIPGLGDFNGDGSIGLLLHDPGSGQVSFGYLGFVGGNYSQPAAARGVQIPPSWQN